MIGIDETIKAGYHEDIRLVQNTGQRLIIIIIKLRSIDTRTTTTTTTLLIHKECFK